MIRLVTLSIGITKSPDGLISPIPLVMQRTGLALALGGEAEVP
jgi:hypothetical protein